MSEIIFKEESYQLVGACMEVYNEMGSGFLEAVYQECLEYEFTDRNIPFVSQAQLTLRFKERMLKSIYIPDFVIDSKIIVEIKGVSDLNDKFRAQMLNYLKATKLRLGLLVNFGRHGKLQYERIVR
ncbi:GxxExxY protein [Neorhodopirellula lusitana]|uniref:GxxExxY protein n=1 Tax=Neorhodopirellula lusitana TaxID=445327 RepID=UPI003850733F